MNRKYTYILLSGLLGALLLAIAYQLGAFTSKATQPTTLLIGAAASLQNALEDLDPVFEGSNPDIRVNYSFAASGPLQQQIEQGAPIDLFISAATRQMDALQTKSLILSDTRRNVLTNSLVLVVPQNSTLKLTNFQQLTNVDVKRISVGEPRSVPAGQYAEEVFRNLNILNQLRPKLVYGNSVRSVLGTVETGNADGGIVYATDARISNRVRTIATVPKNLHSEIVYPMAIVSASRNQKAARLYAQFLVSSQAQAIFKQYGFGVVQ